ncbi:MAG: PAC2 family protein [Candidatus Bathyarchaeia archaeon]
MEIKYLVKPKGLVSDLVAAWPGMGMLAVITAEHLRKVLNADLVAEVYAPLNSIAFKDGVLGESAMESKLYLADGGDRRLLICIGDSQPLTAPEVYDLAESVVQVAKELGVKRVITAAATLSRFQSVPKVYGIVTNRELLSLLKECGIPPASGEGRITGLNGVLLDVAQKAGMDGICLLGQIRYVDVPQPRSASAVLKVLAKLLNLSIDVSDLEKEADRLDASIRDLMKPKVQPEKPTGKGLDYIG